MLERSYKRILRYMFDDWATTVISGVTNKTFSCQHCISHSTLALRAPSCLGTCPIAFLEISEDGPDPFVIR